MATSDHLGSAVSSRPSGHSSHADESDPLVSSSKEGGENHGDGHEDHGVDVEVLLEHAIAVRLPRLSVDGGFVTAGRKKKDPGAAKKAKKGQTPQNGKKGESDPKALFLQKLKKRMPDMSPCVPKWPPKRAHQKACVAKYWANIAVQSVYIGVMVAIGSLQRMADEETQDGRLLNATEEVADAVDTAETNYVLIAQLWVAGMGVVTQSLYVFKSVRAVVKMLFSFIDKIHDEVHTAIEKLMEEVEEEVHELIEDVVKGNEMVAQTASSSISHELRGAVEKAQDQLDVDKLLPWPLATEYRCALTMTAPCALVIAIVGIVQLCSSLSEDSSEGERRLIAQTEEMIQQRANVVTNTLLSVFWSWLESWPVIRFICNNAIGMVERLTNEFLLEKVKEHIPGGTKRLQSMMDALQEGSLSSMTRACTNSCSVM